MSRSLCRWRRNQDGAICRRSIKKVLEVLVVKHVLAEHWALPGVSHHGPHARHSSFIHPPANGTAPACGLCRPFWTLSLVPNDNAGDWAVLQVFGPLSIPGRWAALALHPRAPWLPREGARL